jgi:predicted HicB family RNase H-like nuclease
MEKQQRPPFGLRMPKDLHEWVKKMANEQGRSMNNFVVHVLQSQRQANEAVAQK